MKTENFPELIRNRVVMPGEGPSYSDMIRFIEKLDVAIERSGMKQADLSRMTGVSTGAISEILSGKRKPRFEQVALLAKAVGVSLDYLADDAQESPPVPLGDAEKSAIKIIRANELSENEVIKRLTREPGRPPKIELEEEDGPKKRKSRRA